VRAGCSGLVGSGRASRSSRRAARGVGLSFWDELGETSAHGVDAVREGINRPRFPYIDFGVMRRPLYPRPQRHSVSCCFGRELNGEDLARNTRNKACLPLL